MDYHDALKILSDNKSGRNFPGKSDPRYSDNFITPIFNPKFGIDLSTVNSVFTIGSCFARNIEEVLKPMGVNLPTTKFSAPKHEWPFRPNGLLNEFNPGSICQKIIATLEGKSSPEETIYKQGDLYHDLLLSGGNGVTFERALERRREIEAIYQNLIDSEVVIITLGFVEAWYDTLTSQWLNRMPPFGKNMEKGRFVFKRLNVTDIMPMLNEAISALTVMGKKIILTVSPVPIGVTMTNSDCAVANEFSKSVLRVCAETVKENFDNVDYFPSYEMVRTAGFAAYDRDNVHVKEPLVKMITNYMVTRYQEV